MSEYEVKNALIKRAEITTEDYGCVTVWLYLDYGGEGQGFGGYSLYLPKGNKYHSIKSFCGHFIYRVLEIAGVKKWSELEGKTIRVKASNTKVEAIGHILKDDWFCPSEDFLEAEMREAKNGD
jgi:hypothetical protein